ncbi:MAG: coenzyme-B sulfoethylthiotransferase subunit beta [Candidatus Helarchaeota archaeon]
MIKDKVDIYNDEGECIGEDLPIKAFSPLYNPHMIKIYNMIKRTAFISLEKLEQNIRRGRFGEMTALRQDEIQMPQFERKWKLVSMGKEIVEKMKKIIFLDDDFNGKDSKGDIDLIAGDKIIRVTLPQRRIDVAASSAPLFTITGTALIQALTELLDLNPLHDIDGCNVVKTAVFGRFPQTREFGSSCPLFAFIKPPQMEEGIGTLFRGLMINHIVALANFRTFDAVALATILEQGGQTEMGNALGWYERYCLLTTAYQGFNGNNLVLDLIKEYGVDGTIADVVHGIVGRALADGVIYPKGDKYPNTQPSGFKIYSTKDYPLWNAYSCAGLLAAVCVNIGASRAAQGVGAVASGFADLLSFETGGLPDPDAGRIMGTALGFTFYTHSIYGGAGPGAFTMDHVIARHTSGFFTPCVAAAMCLDAGTQIFTPKLTSGNYVKLRKEIPLLVDVVEKTTEAAKQIKNRF